MNGNNIFRVFYRGKLLSPNELMYLLSTNEKFREEFLSLIASDIKKTKNENAFSAFSKLIDTL